MEIMVQIKHLIIWILLAPMTVRTTNNYPPFTFSNWRVISEFNSYQTCQSALNDMRNSHLVAITSCFADCEEQWKIDSMLNDSVCVTPDAIQSTK